MRNNMEEVAKLFGLNVGDYFEINECSGKFLITCNGLFLMKNYYNWEHSPETLYKLLSGEYTIKLMSWKPRFNEKYYSIGVDGSVEDGTWLNDFVDYTLYKIGNCYRTIEEARANRVKWGTFYDSDEVLNI